MALHHKLCHTMGGLFDLPHAETHTIVLPHAAAYNAPSVPGAMAIVARALGARVYRLPEPEIGWVRLASQHPGLAGGPWLEWHRDGFDLPPGARELATGGVSVQAYAIGPHLGLQFHPEATEPITGAWLRAAQPPLTPAQAGRLSQGWQDAGDRTTAEAGVLFSAWLDGDFAPAPPGPGPAPAAVAAQ